MNYLGKTGITATSANHLANIAKELIKSIELKNIKFVDKYVQLISGEKKLLNKGIFSTENINSTIETIAELISFCAWVREAIKFKDSLLNNLSSMDLKEYCKLTGKEYPAAPQCPEDVTEQDIRNEMSVKEMFEYLQLEAIASTYGKYIHPEGSISSAREEHIYRKQTPCDLVGEGRDALIYTYELSISEDEVESTFMQLQSKYRLSEKKLNAMKAAIKDRKNSRNLALQQEYQVNLHAYEIEKHKLISEMNSYVTQKSEEIASLKILIPKELESIYQFLNKRGE